MYLSPTWSNKQSCALRLTTADPSMLRRRSCFEIAHRLVRPVAQRGDRGRSDADNRPKPIDRSGALTVQSAIRDMRTCVTSKTRWCAIQPIGSTLTTWSRRLSSTSVSWSALPGYDLGEALRVVLPTTTECEGKALKPPCYVQNRRRGEREQDGHRRVRRL